MRAVLSLGTLICVSSLLACGAGRHVQKGINAYNVNNFHGAMVIWTDLEPKQGSLNDKGLVRYLVYRGLTHHRLGQTEPAKAFLTRGRAAYLQGKPNWLPPHVVSQMNGALGGAPAAPAEPAVAPPPEPAVAPPPPPEGATEIQ